jgi:tetratricopeptide (TPR) repeat protein
MGRARIAFAPFFMRTHFAPTFLAVVAVLASVHAFAAPLRSQAPSHGAAPAAPSQTAVDAQPSAQHAIDLARTGHCAQAIPLLKRANAATSDKDTKREIGQAGVKCAMTLGQAATAVDFLNMLTRELPHDPAVLYLATHVYSDLSLRASQDLAMTAPHSREAMQLQAEALEEQGKWDEARAELEEILKEDPKAQGVHYSIGQIILSQPPTATTGDDARAQFQAELNIDPANAGAEYVLGELARSQQQWDEAIAHFSKAVKLDASFADAYRGLGTTYNSAEKYDQAISPLQQYVKLQPRDPAGHYQLAIAYARSGHRDEAAKEMTIQRDLDAKARAAQNGQAPPQAQPQ